MGKIASVIDVEKKEINKEKIVFIKMDPSGGAVLTVPLFQPAGIDSLPVAGDYVKTSSNLGDNKQSAVGFIDPDCDKTAEKGEIRIYGRNSSGSQVCEIHLKNDGTIKINNDSGFIELEQSGKISLNGNLTVDR